MIVLEELAQRKSPRQIAIAMYGEDVVKTEGFDADSPLRGQVRRLVEKARYLRQGGYLELAAGLRPRL